MNMSTTKVEHFDEGTRCCPGKRRGVWGGGSNHIEASARSKREQRHWHLKAKWWGRLGEESGREVINDQPEALARRAQSETRA